MMNNLDLTKFKAFADNKLNVAELMINSVCYGLETNARKVFKGLASLPNNPVF